MNSSYFVLVAALLSFATGFFVAAIIWAIKWALIPREEKLMSEKSIQFLHIFSRRDYLRSFSVKRNDQVPSIDELLNKELYQYYHGKN